jgi:hypothetical protein
MGYSQHEFLSRNNILEVAEGHAENKMYWYAYYFLFRKGDLDRVFREFLWNLDGTSLIKIQNQIVIGC